MKEIVTEINSLLDIDQFGGIHLFKLFTKDFFSYGYEIGDIVTININGKDYDTPVVVDFNTLDINLLGLTTCIFGADYITLLSLGNAFAEEVGLVKENDDFNAKSPWLLANGVTFPMNITIRLKEKGGYLKWIKLYDLDRTCNREDYLSLNDLEFTNFREINVGKIKPGRVYRTGSPIDPLLKRNKYADEAIKTHHIKSIINLTDREGKAKGFPDFDKTYYSSCDILYLCLPAAFVSKRVKAGIKSAIQFMINHKGPYAIHCLEGKDRTGYFVALIECLCGATLDEIKNDYVLSYVNFFKIDEERKKVLSERIVKTLIPTFKKERFNDSELSLLANEYFLEIGLSQDDINDLKRILTD